MTRVRFAGVLCCVLSFAACRPGLHRTSFDSWEVRDFDLAGVRVEIPSDVYQVGELPGRASVLMHPVNPPVLVLDEARPTLEIEALSMSMDGFAERQSSVQKMRRDESQMRFWKWDRDWHESIDEWTWGAQLVLRRDIDCGDGGVVSAAATLMLLDTEVARNALAEDKAAMRRILLSIQCL